MNSNEKFKWCIATMHAFFRIISVNVTGVGTRLTIKSYCIFSCFVCGIACSIATVCAAASVVAISMSMAMVLAIFQVSKRSEHVTMPHSPHLCLLQQSSYYLFTTDFEFLYQLILFIDDIYQKNARNDTAFVALFHRYSSLSKRIVIITAGVYLGTHSMIVLPSIADYIFTGRMTPVLGIFVPGVTDDQPTLLFLVVLLNYVITICGAFTIVPHNILIYLIFTNMPITSDIFAHQMDELAAELNQPKHAVVDVKMRILQIIYMYEKYLKSIRDLDNGFYRISFCQYITSSIYTVICIFVVVKVRADTLQTDPYDNTYIICRNNFTEALECSPSACFKLL